ncbi:MAG: hypothetical protein CfClM3_0250 [Methanobrevibacter sp. CfCl-M3]
MNLKAIFSITAVIFTMSVFISSNHAVDPSNPGTTIVHPGETDILIIMDLTNKTRGNITNYIVRVDDPNNTTHANIIDGILYLYLDPYFTYEDHLYMLDFFKRDPIWYTKVVPWDPVIETNNYYSFDKNTDLTNAEIGCLYIPLTPVVPLPDTHVTLHLDNGLHIGGLTDEQGRCHFDLSGVDFSQFKTGYVDFIGNESHSSTRSYDVPISLVLDNITNDTNDTVTNGTDNGTVMNGTNGTVDILKPLEDALTDIGESLPVTGIPVIVGLLACIASILIIKRN